MSAQTADLQTPPTSPASKVARRLLPSPITGQEFVLVGVIAALWIVLGLTTPSFLSAPSIRPLLVSVAPVALIGVGMTFVIITAGIDISVAAIIMVCAVSVAKLIVNEHLGLIPAVALSIGIGLVLGLVNGLLISLGRIHAIIVTFGTANLFQFVGLRIFNSSTINGIPSTLDVLGFGQAGTTLGVPNSFAITVVVVAVGWWFLRYTRAGRHLFAIGGNPVAARLAGVHTRVGVTWTYVLTGGLSGLAACILIASGTSTLDQSVGSGYELAVIAAVVIGGTSIIGGRGSVVGSLLGAILVQTVSSGVTQLGWPSQLSNLFVGAFIVVAVGTDLLRQRARRKK